MAATLTALLLIDSPTTVHSLAHRAALQQTTSTMRIAIVEPCHASCSHCACMLIVRQIAPLSPRTHRPFASSSALLLSPPSVLSNTMQAVHARNLMFWKASPAVLTGQVVLVTGAGSGIGLNVSLVYAARASKLVLVDRDAAALQAAKLKCEEAGAAAVICITVDVTDFKAVQAMQATTIEQFKQLDVLVLCAGLGAHHLFDATPDLAIFKKLMDVSSREKECAHAIASCDERALNRRIAQLHSYRIVSVRFC